MRKQLKRAMAILLAAAMALSMTAVGAFAEGEGAPPAGGGGSMPPPPPGGGGPSVYTEGGAATDLESKTYENVEFPVCVEDNAAGVRAGEGVTATIIGSTIEKSAGDLAGDAASFYGTNSGLHTYKDAQVTVKDSTVHTNATGANGVFAYGKSTITLENTVVDTDGRGSGGIMVAGGGKLYATDCQVTTEGGSSAAIRSDRGGGLMEINGGSYISNGSIGTGSPAVYCVADITVSNATLVAKNAQAFCFEGRNPGKVYNCYLEGNYTASDDDEASNVMVYQSMSGDSEEGTSYFTMVGGVLKAVNDKNLEHYKMFYTTNTYCYISLYDVEMIYPATYESFLLCACNTNMRGWGTAGKNGSECVLYCIDQDIKGNIEFDTWSYLDCYFTDGSVAETAFVQREDNGDRGCSVYLDSTSQIILTGDSTVQNLYTGGAAIVDEAGKTVSIKSADGTAYVTGDSPLTITVTGTYSTEDKSAQSNVAKIGTETHYSFDPIALAQEYVDASYVPADESGKTYDDAHDFSDLPAPIVKEYAIEGPDTVEAGQSIQVTLVEKAAEPQPDQPEVPDQKPDQKPDEKPDMPEPTEPTEPSEPIEQPTGETYVDYMIAFAKSIEGSGEQSLDELIAQMQAATDYTGHPFSMFVDLFGAMSYADWQAAQGGAKALADPVGPSDQPGEPPAGDPPAGDPIPNTVTFTGENFSIKIVVGEATDDANIIQTASGAHEVTFQVVPAEGFTVKGVSTANNVTCTENGDGSYTIGFTMEGDTDAVVTVETAPSAGRPDVPSQVTYTWKSSDSSIATVAGVEEGQTATVTGVAPGTVTISAVEWASGEELATFTLTVTDKGEVLFNIDPESVTKMVVQNGSTGLRYTLRNAQEIQQIVSALNGFRYTETKPVDVAGWSQRIIATCGEETVDMTITKSDVSLNGQFYISDGQPLADIVALIDEIFAQRQPDFGDVSSDQWYFDPVMECADAGIINGYEDGTFLPNKAVNRAEAAKMIVLATGTPVDDSAVPSFTDCSGENVSWAVPYIAAAEKAGLMKGLDAANFDPNGTMTRAQLAALICQAKGLTSTEGAKSFPDVPAAEWYADEVAMASAAGYVKGDDQGNYNPNKSVTRAEFAQVIYNMYLK